MVKAWAVLVVLAAFLLAAPVMESATTASTEVFQAIGNACGGA